MTINRMLINLCANNVQQSKKFYIDLFDFKVNFDSDWFVNLVSTQGTFEIGIIQADHELVPKQYQGKAKGMYVCFVVDDVEVIHQQAQQMAVEIIQPPEMTFYGQKRLLLTDPAGVLVDVSAPEGKRPNID